MPRLRTAKASRPRPRGRAKANAAAAPSRPLKIGQVAELLGVATSLLRFWETEFPAAKAKKTRTQQRFYTTADVEKLREIKRLLKVEGYTIAGARRQLGKKPGRAKEAERLAEALREAEALRGELGALKARHQRLRTSVAREVEGLDALDE